MNDENPLKSILGSSSQALLAEVEIQIGTIQVTRKYLEFVPDLLVRTAMDGEFDYNWASVTESVEAQNIPCDENLISTNFVFKIRILSRTRGL